jgi:hypothetical protein
MASCLDTACGPFRDGYFVKALYPQLRVVAKGLKGWQGLVERQAAEIAELHVNGELMAANSASCFRENPPECRTVKEAN